MTKQDVVYFRDLFKDELLCIVCDNEHNFFDNCKDQISPIWDDENERVMYIQTNQEGTVKQSEMSPYTISITEYEHIQIMKCVPTRQGLIEFLKSNKSNLGNDKYDYALQQVSKSFNNSRPNHEPYYK